MSVSLRKVNRTDWDYILSLRNNEEFRSFFYEQHTIKKKEHYTYLQKQKINPNFFNWIICYNDKRVGYLRVLDNDISIMIEKKYHGKNIGTKAIKLLEEKATKLGLTTLIGKVMIHNKKSKQIFVKNKYKLKMWWFEKDLTK